MGPPPGQPVGVAIVRVWREDDDPAVLRARVITVDDVVVPTAATGEWSGSEADAVLAHLRSWLERWPAPR